MSHRKKLILWPGFGSLLTWFFGPEFSIGLAMILLVLLTAYIPAAHAERPRRDPRVIALGAFLIWLAVFWLIVLATIPLRPMAARWTASELSIAWGEAVYLLVLALFVLVGLAAGMVQILVLRRNGVPIRPRYSLIGLATGFAILGCSFIWNQAAGSDLTIMLPAFFCGVPALMLLEGKPPAPAASRFPVRAVLMGESVATGGAAATSAVVATGVAGLAVVQSGLSLADLNPIGRHGTTPLSLALLWFLTFTATMGFALLLKVVRIRKTQPAFAGHPLPEVENPTSDTDGWSAAAIMMATGLVGLSALLLGLAGIEALGFRVTEIVPHQILLGLLVALFMTARGAFGAMLDFLFLGLVAWGLYGLYVILTFDPVNVWVDRAVTVLVPG
jgi:hypothetical protein